MTSAPKPSRRRPQESPLTAVEQANSKCSPCIQRDTAISAPAGMPNEQKSSLSDNSMLQKVNFRTLDRVFARSHFGKKCISDRKLCQLKGRDLFAIFVRQEKKRLNRGSGGESEQQIRIGGNFAQKIAGGSIRSNIRW
jgi:hypothetical protein